MKTEDQCPTCGQSLPQRVRKALSEISWSDVHEALDAGRECWAVVMARHLVRTRQYRMSDPTHRRVMLRLTPILRRLELLPTQRPRGEHLVLPQWVYSFATEEELAR
jgi:hypothetical protein